MEFDQKRDEKPNLEWIEQKVDWTTTVDLVDWKGIIFANRQSMSAVKDRIVMGIENIRNWRVLSLRGERTVDGEMTDCEGLTTEKRRR